MKVSSLVKNAVYSAAKKPTAATLPKGISPEGVPMWKITLKRFGKVIRTYKSNVEKWAAAIVLYKKMCDRRGIVPFLELKSEKSGSPAALQLAGFVDPTLRELERIEKSIKGYLKGKPKKFTLKNILRSGPERILVCTKEWKFLKNRYPAAAIATIIIPKFGFKKERKNTFVKVFSPKVKMILQYKSKSAKTANLIIELKVSKRVWDSLMQIKRDAKVFLKKWVKRGFKAEGALEIDTKTLEMLKEIYPSETIDQVSDLINNISIPNLVNLGEEDFQISLAKYIIDKAEYFNLVLPENLKNFVEDKEYRRKSYKNYLISRPDDLEELE